MFDARMREFLVRLLALAGLGFSVLLLVEYISPSYAVCRAGGGCDVIRLSEYASILGIHTPAYGVAFFAAVLALTLIPDRRTRPVLIALTAAGAVAALVFLYIQKAKIGQFCIFCVATDGAALVIAALAASLRKAPAPRLELPHYLVYGIATAAVVSAAIAIPTTQREEPPEMELVGELPEAVTASQVDGTVTIVEFVDFQCPACRAQHQQMTGALRGYDESEVRIVYKMSPIPSHMHAEDAARAFLCAGDHQHEMVDALFTASQPSKDFADRYAQKLGLDMTAYRACLESEETNRALEEDDAAATAAEVRGLPTGYIGHQRFEGVRPAAEIRRAIERAKK